MMKSSYLACASFVGLLALPGTRSQADSACACTFQGRHLAKDIYNNFPEKSPAGCEGSACTKTPGMYAAKTATPLYGTMCAAWDQVPDTPWIASCPEASNWSHPDFNWCQQPWCYVDQLCSSGVASSVFSGSNTAFYSYLACGSTADCYTNIAWAPNPAWPTGCPYDPTGGKTYKVHKSGDCACTFQGKSLGADIFTLYPTKDEAEKMTPGMYKSLSSITFYGTTCGAWDQMPGTPWYSFCPGNADWCHADYNWCQEPWCYVDTKCSTGVASSVFKGSPVAFYSYDTCLSAPDCYTKVAWNIDYATNAPAACPYDASDSNWHTAKKCASFSGGPTPAPPPTPSPPTPSSPTPSSPTPSSPTPANGDGTDKADGSGSGVDASGAWPTKAIHSFVSILLVVGAAGASVL